MELTNHRDRPPLDQRKQAEVDFHNEQRFQRVGQKKYYSINRGIEHFVEKWLYERCAGKHALVYGCGDGMQSFFLARNGATVVGIDIADNSIKLAKEQAEREGLTGQVSFEVMDCENLNFADSSTDIIVAHSVLHHLDLPRAYSEMARVLKPSGGVICVEPLGHNPLIQFYRRRTPTLRTEWEMEHILKLKHVELAKQFFERVDVRFFHLFTLLAVPFHKRRSFGKVLGALEAVDSVALRIPYLRRQAWQVVFVLSGPKKPA
jgi:ubiquinone/menaquinone biosynthesis C-methylase UbiE